MSEAYDTSGNESAASEDERRLVAALRRGDEVAFTALIGRYHPMLVRLALPLVGSRDIAEDVAQETWLGVLQGIDRFEGRSSLKTWISRILLNRARTRAVRARRTLPFSALATEENDIVGSAVEAEWFFPTGHPEAGWWVSHPADWRNVPEEALLACEIRAEIEATIAALPPAQQTVINLRDVEGWSADEVCRLLGISEGNQRVLLHRARARVRGALERSIGAP